MSCFFPWKSRKMIENPSSWRKWWDLWKPSLIFKRRKGYVPRQWKLWAPKMAPVGSVARRFQWQQIHWFSRIKTSAQTSRDSDDEYSVSVMQWESYSPQSTRKSSMVNVRYLPSWASCKATPGCDEDWSPFRTGTCRSVEFCWSPFRWLNHVQSRKEKWVESNGKNWNSSLISRGNVTGNWLIRIPLKFHPSVHWILPEKQQLLFVYFGGVWEFCYSDWKQK